MPDANDAEKYEVATTHVTLSTDSGSVTTGDLIFYFFHFHWKTLLVEPERERYKSAQITCFLNFVTL